MKLFFYIINILLYLVSLATWLAMPDMLIFNFVLTAVCLIITSILIWVDRKRFSVLYKTRLFGYFTDTSIRTILLASILSLLCYLVYKHPVMFDVTKMKRFSLSSETVRVLNETNSDLEFTLITRAPEKLMYMSLLDLFRLNTKRISIQHYDPDLNPQLIAQYKIQKVPALILKGQNRFEIVYQIDELEIVQAILKNARTKMPVIYYTNNHLELNLDNQEPNGGSFLKNVLIAKQFNLKELDLKTVTEIPSDANVLAIIGPRESFLEQELLVIKKYIDNGGQLVLALDPEINSTKMDSLRKLFEQWGIFLRNDLVLDTKKFVDGSNGTVPVINEFNLKSNWISEFKGQVFFPLVSSIGIDESFSDDVVVNFMTSTFPQSFAVEKPSEILSGKLAFQEGRDLKGPLALSVTYENKKKDQSVREKMVIFSNSTFLINQYQNFSSNHELFAKSVDWLSFQVRALNINAPMLSNSPIFIGQSQMAIIFYLCIIFIPLCFFVVAFWMYKRKNQNLT